MAGLIIQQTMYILKFAVVKEVIYSLQNFINSCTVKVTFFDDIAQELEDAINNEVGANVVIIIASAKIGSFQGTYI